MIYYSISTTRVWSSEQGKCVFPVPIRLRIWYRQTGSAVPSCDSLIILHTKVESCVYSRDFSRFPRRRPFIYTANHHRSVPSFIGSSICVPMAFTAESPPAQGAVLPGNFCLFPHSLLVLFEYMCDVLCDT